MHHNRENAENNDYCITQPATSQVLWSHTGPCAQKGTMLGLMLSCCHLEILNTFIFKFLCCKQTLMEQ